MFARTPRLLLRPGWPEDAAALADAIGHEQVARMTSRVPWPYALADAQAFLALPADHRFPSCVILAHGAGTEPGLVGGVSLYDADGAMELGYWLTPSAWGRGYATEAARAMLAHARHALGASRVQAGHFADNPASGRVLRKLGFVPTGADVPYPCLSRGGDAAAVRYSLDLETQQVPVAA
jgi:RimJ/RimL family protein N-acetyltransferase